MEREQMIEVGADRLVQFEVRGPILEHGQSVPIDATEIATIVVDALLSPVSCPECRGGGRVLVRPFPGSSWDDGFGPCRACTSTGSLLPLVVLRTEHDAKVAAMDDEVEAANDNALRAVLAVLRTEEGQ